MELVKSIYKHTLMSFVIVLIDVIGNLNFSRLATACVSSNVVSFSELIQ